MRERLASETGKALYKMRKAIVEPVFGQIKEARNFRRFRLRGLKNASGEWKLICATHNLSIEALPPSNRADTSCGPGICVVGMARGNGYRLLRKSNLIELLILKQTMEARICL